MTSTSADLSGKVALITGAGRGIGLAIAQALAEHGAAVAIPDIDAAVADAEAAKLRAAGKRAIALGGDMSDLSILQGLIDRPVAEFGGMHILVNNAAIQKSEPWHAITNETALRQWTANMLAPLRLTQLLCDRFKSQKFGRVINISSIQARRGNPNMMAYSMSKAAINNFTSALGCNHDLASNGVTVNGIAPGWFDTYRNTHDFSSEAEKVEKGRRVPVGRVGEPRDCAGLAVLLCSEAGAYISGETIVVSGGL